MGTRILPLEVPDELIALLGTPDAVTERAREALVLDLLRQGHVGQGKAAQLLGITRGALLDLAAAHRIPSGPESTEELAGELEAGRRYLKRR
jgi:predicted HTH domain antitoxin